MEGRKEENERREVVIEKHVPHNSESCAIVVVNNNRVRSRDYCWKEEDNGVGEIELVLLWFGAMTLRDAGLT